MKKVRFPTVSSITGELLATVVQRGGSYPRSFHHILSGRLGNVNVIPLEDRELPPELWSVARQFRKIPTIYAYDGPVARLVDLKVGDTQKDAIVFWKPRLIWESTGKTSDEQTEFPANICKELELPEGFLGSFGEASLLTQLTLSHRDLTGEDAPPDYMWARTDTVRLDGKRISLRYFDEDGLESDSWDEDGELCDLGVFPLGVVEIESGGK